MWEIEKEDKNTKNTAKSAVWGDKDTLATTMVYVAVGGEGDSLGTFPEQRGLWEHCQGVYPSR